MNDMNVENTEGEGITVIIGYAQAPKQPVLLVHTSLKLLFFLPIDLHIITSTQLFNKKHQVSTRCRSLGE